MAVAMRMVRLPIPATLLFLPEREEKGYGGWSSSSPHQDEDERCGKRLVFWIVVVLLASSSVAVSTLVWRIVVQGLLSSAAGLLES